MKCEDLQKWIASMAQDIDFSYKGFLGSICPISDSEIDLCYGDYTVTANSVREAMELPFIEGRSLSDLCEQLAI